MSPLSHVPADQTGVAAGMNANLGRSAALSRRLGDHQHRDQRSPGPRLSRTGGFTVSLVVMVAVSVAAAVVAASVPLAPRKAGP
jgi:hypothetical protein